MLFNDGKIINEDFILGNYKIFLNGLWNILKLISINILINLEIIKYFLGKF